jgi:transaldolase
MNPLNQLAELGQSFWYDNIQRSLLKNGTIEDMINEDSLTGLTSNPAIFHKAISKSNDYDQAIADLIAHGTQLAPLDLYE